MGSQNSLRVRQRNRLLSTFAAVAMMIVVLGIALFLLRRRDAVVQPRVAFDPAACVRVFDVTRVYKIETAPGDSRSIWFGTAEGVHVLDTASAQWTRFGLEHGLASETIADICFAGDDVWVASWSGIAKLDSSGTRFVPLAFTVGLGGGRILAIEYLEGAGIYFSVDGRGLYRLADSDTLPQQVRIPGVKASARITMLEKLDGELAVGIEDRRLVVLDGTGEDVREVAFSREDSPKTLIWDIVRHEGKIYVATSNDGVWTGESLADTLQPIEDFPAKGAYCFAGEPDGFWCGTPFGLWRYHAESDAWIQFVHPDQREATDFQVFTLANTPSVLWYGSMNLGAGFMRKNPVEWHDMRAGLSNPNVASLAATDSLLWTSYGYQGGYLDLFAATNIQHQRSFAYRDGVRDPHVQTLVSAGDRVYFGTYRGFGYLVPATGDIRYFDGEDDMPFGDIAAIAPADSPDLYLAGLFGVLEYDSSTEAFSVVEATRDVRATCLYPDGPFLWYGTLGKGVYLLNRVADSLVMRALTNAHRIVGIGEIATAEGRALFVAAKRNGCHLIDPQSREIRKLDIPGGYMRGPAEAYKNHIMAMRVIDGRVWLGIREGGCLIYDPGRDTWNTFTYYDGLVSDEVRSLYDTDDHVWVGCYGGFNRLDKTYVTRLKFGESASSAREVACAVPSRGLQAERTLQ